MKLTIAMHHRFHRTPNGKIWSWIFGKEFWDRYLQVFDEISVLARAQDVEEVPDNWKLSNIEGVNFRLLPYYLGPAQYIKQALKIRKIAKEVANSSSDAFILRGGQISSLLAGYLKKRGYPYGVEVIGDPYDFLSSGVMKHPLRGIFRHILKRDQKILCANAAVTMYVTKEALQNRYPCPSGMIGVSDVELIDEYFVETPRPIPINGKHNLLMVGTVDHYTKSPDLLIDAVAKCIHAGWNLNLTIVGGGRHKEELEKRAYSLGIRDNVRMLGYIPAGTLVREQMDRADLFILPSRVEGLPRALVEAMARGLPCIGSTVGGIPELLSPEDMVPAGNLDELAQKIREVVSDPSRMARMADRNLNVARTYHKSILEPKRLEFYRIVKKKTVEWRESQ